MASVSLKNVVKRFGAVQVIHGASLDIEDGEFVVFVGPSGCGKSTLLRIVAGLEDASEGEVMIGGKTVNDVEPADRGIAMVFQSYALYPHMTARQNLSFGLRMTGHPKDDIERRVKRAADILRIGELLERRPAQLSGGQRQRVAIGRAIMREPQVFLFDEPLSNLDAELRVQMRVELARLHSELGVTMIYVTHDQTEAMTLADKIVVLRDGRIEQIGKPLQLYDDPINRFVAGFVGSPRMNFLAAELVAKDVRSTTVALVNQNGARLALPIASDVGLGAPLVIGIRPEHIKPSGAGDCELSANIDVVEHLGATSFAYANTKSGEPLVIERDDLAAGARPETLAFSIPADRAYLFDAGGKRIR
ncbi:MAG TPA: sn-glycerol-3-phosphate ABC transporter ATP-binding protein UgpC [Rhizobiaceae bacterium]|nr:sn-glycerol-3-phosphate ABC transporter ATP-binding protein UgpC [Rhizobiaceae bacterium]